MNIHEGQRVIVKQRTRQVYDTQAGRWGAVTFGPFAGTVTGILRHLASPWMYNVQGKNGNSATVTEDELIAC